MSEPLTKEQRRYVESEMGQLRYHRHHHTPVPDPPAVKRARRMLSAHDSKIRRVHEKLETETTKLRDAVRYQLNFGDRRTCLAALEKLKKHVKS